MFRFVLSALLLLPLLLTGCGQEQAPQDKAAQQIQNDKALVLYSELDNKFTADLVQSFNEQNKEKLTVKFISELKPDEKLPDLVLAEKRTLYGLKRQQKLKPVAFTLGDKLPKKLRDADMCWYGVFYDPTVFLINQQYARTIGQQSLRGWADLENKLNLRIAIENLSDSNSTQNFLGAFADALGETSSLNYLWNINRFVGQYAKFPFTSIRMTAVGDADLAITRQSYVFKYLENKFPAYVVQPREGTPVNLYCVGMFADCQQELPALQFIEWLLSGDKVQAVAQADNTGFMFIFPRGVQDAPVDADKLWLNENYLDTAKQKFLTERWLERVRFSR